MRSAVPPLITNVRSYIEQEKEFQQWSCIRIEGSKPFTYSISVNCNGLVVDFEDAELNMPPYHLKILDGLVQWVDVSTTPAGKGCIKIFLERVVPYEISDHFRDVPSNVVIRFNRDYIHQVFAGKKIVVDPGHGGKDRGAKGPVNLLEKNVTLKIASRLRDDLTNLGADVVLTRLADTYYTFEDRIAFALKCEADVFVSIHTGWHANRNISGATARYLSPSGKNLAEDLCREIVKKLGCADLGVGRSDLYSPKLKIPAAIIKPVCISNPTEEGELRSITFIERTSLAMVNGIKAFFMSENR